MTDFQKTLYAVIAYAKEFKLSLDDIGKLDLITEYRKESAMFKGLDPKTLKGVLGRSRETIISEAQNRFRLESIGVEQAFYADKINSIPELAAMTDDQKQEIAAKICEVKKPDWKAASAATADMEVKP
jgi:hypothetical protein